MLKHLSVLVCLTLGSCGLYLGTEGVIYNPGDLTGFRTPQTDAQVEADRKAAYQAGLAEAQIPEPTELDDGSVTVVTPEQVATVGGDALKAAVPFAGAGGLLLTIIVGGVTRCLRRRKRKQA